MKTKNRLISVIITLTMALSFWPMAAKAADIAGLAAAINSFDPGNGGGSGQLAAVVDTTNKTITVTGMVNDAMNQLELNMDSSITVKWAAYYSGNTSSGITCYGGFAIIAMVGNGTFEVSSGSITNTGRGSAISSDGISSVIAVRGGEVKTADGIAICTHGNVDVTGGEVFATKDPNLQAPGPGASSGVAVGIFADGVNSIVTVSGGAVATDSDISYAICSQGTNSEVTVSGGTVEASGRNGWAIDISGINSTLTVSGGIVQATGENGYAVITYNTDSLNSTITVNGGIVQATADNGTAIASFSTVIINGGVVRATTGKAITAFDENCTIIVNDGFVFAEGSDIYDVVTLFNGSFYSGFPVSFPGPTGNGIVVAWNRNAGTTMYNEGAANDLIVTPANTAIWHNDSGTGGISYAKNTNIGFVPVAGVMVTQIPGGTVAPAFTLQPSNRSIVVGQNTIFTISASGIPAPTYQWELSANSGATWSNIIDGDIYSNATSATLTLTKVLSSHSGDQYRCTATNAAGSAISNIAALTVTDGGSIGGGGGGGSANANATVNPKTVQITYNDNGDYNDASFTLILNGSILNAIKVSGIGGKTLIKGVDYVLEGSQVTLKNAFLTNLIQGSYTLIIDVSSGDDPQITLSVSDKKINETVVTEAKSQAGSVKVIITVGSKDYTVNGSAHKSDIAPQITADRVFVPIRFVAEAMKAQVDWANTDRTVTVTDGNNIIIMTIGRAYYSVNDTEQTMDAPAYISDGRTLVPLRFIAEGLGATVEWDANAQTVTIEKILKYQSFPSS